MRIFNKTYMKRFLSIVVICTMLVLYNMLLGSVLTPVSYSLYFNHDMEEIKEANEDIDLLFIGASRVYRSFVPSVFEEHLGLNCVVNAGSSSQQIAGTYYQLKDILEQYDVHRVVLGVILDGLIGDTANTQGNLLVYDRLSWKNKIPFVIEVLEGKDKLYAIDTYRFRNNILDVGSIAEEKRAVLEGGYAPLVSNNEYYADKGFVYSKTSYETGTIKIRESCDFYLQELNPERVEYLDACIELCKENGIEVSLVTGPTSVMRMYELVHYQEAVDYYTAYAKEHDIDYHNLNYLVGREDFLPDELMHDWNHVNGEGAYVISKLYAEILHKADAGEDVSEYFYSDLDAFKKDVHRIVAVDGKIEINESGVANIAVTSLQNEDVVPLYQVEMKTGDGEYAVVVDWTEETDLQVAVPDEGDYAIRITAKTGQDGDAMAWQVYEY